MLDKKRLIRAELYKAVTEEDKEPELIVRAQKLEFPQDFFSVKDTDFVIFRGVNILQVPNGTPVSAIFYYQNGTRIRYLTTIDLCTEFQVNVHVGGGYEVLEERRRYFKVNCDIPCEIKEFVIDGSTTILMSPIQCRINNINVGGVSIMTKADLEVGQQIFISFLSEKVELYADVLHIREAEGNPSIKYYGCQFRNITSAQEEAVARFVFTTQQSNRDMTLTG